MLLNEVGRINYVFSVGDLTDANYVNGANFKEKIFRIGTLFLISKSSYFRKSTMPMSIKR